ncbi:MAG: hypothetical protein M2R45_05266 [Verrucomicrobia subdivision 3 bacterium]|nr:hypothetical protein [Limisphaerales bacterium]MCS1412689.1 hypothetical protein [Limisphaerales bacterium]
MMAQAIQSIISSPFTDFEFIIIDGDSTDRLASIVRFYTDPRLRFESNLHPGLCDALNLSVSHGSKPDHCSDGCG